MRHVVKSDQTPSVRSQAFTLSCVVPVFNEGAGIDAFLRALQATAAAITPDFEIVLINDGSTDDSGARILAADVASKLRYLELSRNFGKEIAVQAGLDAATGDCVVILDADFQHPLEMIATMVARWQAGVDMVYAVKHDRNDEGWLNRLAARAFYRIVSSTKRGPRIPPNAGDFRLLDRKVVMALRALPERDRFMKGLYAWVGFKTEALEFKPGEREHGQSKFRFLNLASLAATGITSFSNLPLRWVAGAGVIVSVGSIGMAGWLVVEKIAFGQPIPGFATLSASIFFFSGVQLLALGIVGEYVGRIFNEVKQRPRYILANDVQRDAADQRRNVGG